MSARYSKFERPVVLAQQLGIHFGVVGEFADATSLPLHHGFAAEWRLLRTEAFAACLLISWCGSVRQIDNGAVVEKKSEPRFWSLRVPLLGLPEWSTVNDRLKRSGFPPWQFAFEHRLKNHRLPLLDPTKSDELSEGWASHDGVNRAGRLSDHWPRQLRQRRVEFVDPRAQSMGQGH